MTDEEEADVEANASWAMTEIGKLRRERDAMETALRHCVRQLRLHDEEYGHLTPPSVYAEAEPLLLGKGA